MVISRRHRNLLMTQQYYSGWQPTRLASLQAWVSTQRSPITVSGGKVTSFKGLSKSPNIFTSPDTDKQFALDNTALNGLPALDSTIAERQFASSASVLSYSNDFSTVGVVIRANGEFPAAAGVVVSSATESTSYFMQRTSGQLTWRAGDGASNVDGVGNITTTSLPALDTDTILVGRRSKLANNIEIWHNGTLNASDTHTNPNVGFDSIRIGARSNGTLDFVGYTGEIVVFHEYFSTEYVNVLSGYLAHEWNLQSLLPAGHPYKVNPPS